MKLNHLLCGTARCRSRPRSGDHGRSMLSPSKRLCRQS